MQEKSEWTNNNVESNRQKVPPLGNHFKQESLTPSKVVLILLVVSMTLFLLRPNPIGMDSYFYLFHAGEPYNSNPPLFFYLALLPAWLVSLCCYAIALFCILTLGKHFKIPHRVQFLGLILLAPCFLTRFFMFEDDLLGIVLGLLFLVLFFEKKYFTMVFVSLIGIFTWTPFILFMLFPLVYEAAKKNIGFALTGAIVISIFNPPDFLVMEHYIGIVVAPIFLFLLMFGFDYLRKASFDLKVSGLYFGLMGLVTAKYLWLGVPFLCFATGMWFKEHGKLDWIPYLVLFGLLYSGYFVWNAIPTEQNIVDVQNIVGITKNDVVNNDWTFGHWLRYYGGNPRFDNSLPVANQSFVNASGWVLTTQNVSCPLIENLSSFRLYQCGGPPGYQHKSHVIL